MADIDYYLQLNNAKYVIVERDKDEVLEIIKREFENQYNQYGKLKKEDTSSLDYEILHAWKRIQRHVLSEKDKN